MFESVFPTYFGIEISKQNLYTWWDPKVPEIWMLRANGYEYIEVPLSVSPHTLLESVWQAASSW
jgi:hypothetical protein